MCTADPAPVPKPGSEEHPPSPVFTSTFDDMHDSAEETQYYKHLPLEECRDITRLFQDMDAQARTHQKHHERLTNIAIYCGTAALLAAITVLSLPAWQAPEPARPLPLAAATPSPGGAPNDSLPQPFVTSHSNKKPSATAQAGASAPIIVRAEPGSRVQGTQSLTAQPAVRAETVRRNSESPLQSGSSLHPPQVNGSLSSVNPEPVSRSLESSLEYLEVGFVIIAGISVAIGLATRQKNKWLERRHQAELCRLLKFELLLAPHLWHKDRDQTTVWLRSQLDRIQNLHPEKPVAHVIEEAAPHGPFDIKAEPLHRRVLQQLLQYYEAKRLSLQKAYLENRAGKNEHQISVLRSFYVPTFLFFSAVLAALMHALLSFSNSDTGLLRWAVAACFAAACLPVLGAFFRMLLVAKEYSRNKSRFRSASAALAELEDRLRDDTFAILGAQSTLGAARATSRQEAVLSERLVYDIEADRVRQRSATTVVALDVCPDRDLVDPSNVLRDLSWCEHILRTEHIEWLRLMVETEWFG